MWIDYGHTLRMKRRSRCQNNQTDYLPGTLRVPSGSNNRVLQELLSETKASISCLLYVICLFFRYLRWVSTSVRQDKGKHASVRGTRS